MMVRVGPQACSCSSHARSRTSNAKPHTMPNTDANARADATPLHLHVQCVSQPQLLVARDSFVYVQLYVVDGDTEVARWPSRSAANAKWFLADVQDLHVAGVPDDARVRLELRMANVQRREQANDKLVGCGTLMLGDLRASSEHDPCGVLLSAPEAAAHGLPAILRMRTTTKSETSRAVIYAVAAPARRKTVYLIRHARSQCPAIGPACP